MSYQPSTGQGIFHQRHLDNYVIQLFLKSPLLFFIFTYKTSHLIDIGDFRSFQKFLHLSLETDIFASVFQPVFLNIKLTGKQCLYLERYGFCHVTIKMTKSRDNTKIKYYILFSSPFRFLFLHLSRNCYKNWLNYK